MQSGAAFLFSAEEHLAELPRISMSSPNFFALSMKRAVGVHLAGAVFTALVASTSVLAQTPSPDKPLPGESPSRPRNAMEAPYAKAAIAKMREPLDHLTPVTDEMLRNPP